jgi:hypothetical protein
MVYPNFLVVGAQKAGTTWLYRSLRTHPQVWMPREKELHYFDEKIRLDGGLFSRLRGDRPADWRWRRQVKSRLKRSRKDLKWRDVAWDLKYFLREPNDRWYASLFDPGDDQIAGETTPDYSILGKRTISHVRDIMPEAKIILMMRNPVERPWSVADMGRRIKGESLEDASEDEYYAQLDNRRVRLMTDYLKMLENWSAFYPEEQIFAGFLEDIHFFPEELLLKLYEFLGVDSSAKYRIIRRKIHSGFQSTMPTRYAVHLANSYYDETRRLSERFGGYASFWLYCAERLIEDPPTGEQVPYPFWESPLWAEWKEGREVAMQSGPLPSVWAASG